MIRVSPVSLDPDNQNYLIVIDDSGNRYVIMDLGPAFRESDRFEMYNLTDEGNPSGQVTLEWFLSEGIEGTEFKAGISQLNI